MTKEQIKELWVAANCHSINICGNFLSDGEVDEVTGIPEQPDDEAVIKSVIEYLNGTV